MCFGSFMNAREIIRNLWKSPVFAQKSVGCYCAVHLVLNNQHFSSKKHMLVVNDTWEKQAGLAITL